MLTPPWACPNNDPTADAFRAGIAGFWQAFGSSIHILCLSEVKHALMAQSLVGVPGAMTLLCNLSTTIDFWLNTTQVEHVSVSSLLCSMQQASCGQVCSNIGWSKVCGPTCGLSLLRLVAGGK
jgi:hypothetical protein